MEAHLAHNQENVGSSPISATRSEMKRPCENSIYGGKCENLIIIRQRGLSRSP